MSKVKRSKKKCRKAKCRKLWTLKILVNPWWKPFSKIWSIQCNPVRMHKAQHWGWGRNLWLKRIWIFDNLLSTFCLSTFCLSTFSLSTFNHLFDITGKINHMSFIFVWTFPVWDTKTSSFFAIVKQNLR